MGAKGEEYEKIMIWLYIASVEVASEMKLLLL